MYKFKKYYLVNKKMNQTMNWEKHLQHIGRDIINII